ncbi:MAG: hypothetical protein IJF92_05440 [Bacilli bacterium]|nr:hypothetical protein [Bacilli bacterium]
MDLEKLEKKLSSIFVVLVIIGFILYPIITKLPKVISNFGLNNVLHYKNYKTMIEFDIKDGPDFAIVLDRNNKVLTHLCFNDKSIIINNKNIDNINYKKSINIIFKKLYETDSINNDITITYYDNYSLMNNTTNKVKNNLNNNIDINIKQKKSKLISKAKKLNIKETKYNRIIIMLNMYSSEVINESKKKDRVVNKKIDIDDYKEYSKVVYNKLEKYKSVNNIVNQDINDSKFKIYNIPASDNIYPDNDSWYYIKDNRLYAYIRFVFKNGIYDICYTGSVENFNEGSCEYEK